jgi:hypothetical protein
MEGTGTSGHALIVVLASGDCGWSFAAIAWKKEEC